METLSLTTNITQKLKSLMQLLINPVVKDLMLEEVITNLTSTVLDHLTLMALFLSNNSLKIMHLRTFSTTIYLSSNTNSGRTLKTERTDSVNFGSNWSVKMPLVVLILLFCIVPLSIETLWLTLRSGYGSYLATCIWYSFDGLCNLYFLDPFTATGRSLF